MEYSRQYLGYAKHYKQTSTNFNTRGREPPKHQKVCFSATGGLQMVRNGRKVVHYCEYSMEWNDL